MRDKNPAMFSEKLHGLNEPNWKAAVHIFMHVSSRHPAQIKPKRKQQTECIHRQMHVKFWTLNRTFFVLAKLGRFDGNAHESCQFFTLASGTKVSLHIQMRRKLGNRHQCYIAICTPSKQWLPHKKYKQWLRKNKSWSGTGNHCALADLDVSVVFSALHRAHDKTRQSPQRLWITTNSPLMICVGAARWRFLTCIWSARHICFLCLLAGAWLLICMALSNVRHDGWYGKVDLQRPKRTLGSGKDDEHMWLGWQIVGQIVW